MTFLENPELREPQARRAFLERLKRLLLAAAAGFAFFGLRNFLLGYPITSSINAVGAVIMLAWLTMALKATSARVIMLTVHGALLSAALTLSLGATFSGQSLSVSSWFVAAALPLFACFQLGVRSALIWTAAALTLIFLVHLGEMLWPVTPEFIPRRWEVYSSQVVLMLLVLAFGISFRLVSERYVRQLREQARELASSRDEALAAARLKSQFVATMSHEIRTPLAGVMGMTEILAQTELSGEQREMVEAVIKSSQLLRAVVDDILDFSKLEARSVALEQLVFNPEDALDDVLELFALTARDKGLELALRVGHELPQTVQGDPLRFRQIASNLISNAVKFTRKGAVEVTLEPVTGGLRLEVRDTGVGIPAELLGSLFQPFQQLDSSTTRRYGGTGLGLSISQHLAALMGARIEVESQSGQGSTFTLIFPWIGLPPEPVTSPLQGRKAGILGLGPVSRAGVASRLERLGLEVSPERPELWLVGPEATRPAEGRSLQLRWPGLKEQEGFAASLWLPLRRSTLEQTLLTLFAPASPDGTQKVLIVEDTLINQKVLLRMLTRLGYSGHVVENGAQALSSLHEESFPMVLMDIHMPVMDGVEATRRIRQELPVERQPFICAVSASSHQEQRDEMFQAGANAFIGKPVALSELRSVIEAWARGPLTDRSAESSGSLPPESQAGDPIPAPGGP